MKYFLLIFFILGLSCQSERENIELDVIKSTLPEVVGTRLYQDPPQPPPRKAFLPDSSELIIEPQIGILIDGKLVVNESLIRADCLKRVIERQKWFDSVTLAYKTFNWEQYQKDSIEWTNSIDEPAPRKEVVLKVFDSLISNQGGRLNIVANLGFKKTFQVELKGDFAELLTQLQDSTKNPLHINLENFSTLGRYKIRPKNYQPRVNEKVVATLVLSRVSINAERTKAAYYYQEYCGMLCGYDYVIFAERTAKGWELIGKNMVWIS